MVSHADKHSASIDAEIYIICESCNGVAIIVDVEDGEVGKTDIALRKKRALIEI